MLKNIPSVLSPELLKILCEMGHGDELVIADGNFPSESVGKNSNVVRLDGHKVPEILEAILKFFPLDAVTQQPAGVMATDDGSTPPIWAKYEEILLKEESEKYDRGFEMIERYAFYEKARKCYLIVSTGEKALYANLLLKKGTC